MKMNSRDDDRYAEAHIHRLIREMEDLRDGNDKGIWCDNGASYSPLHSSLYSQSEITTESITPHQGYIKRP